MLLLIVAAVVFNTALLGWHVLAGVEHLAALRALADPGTGAGAPALQLTAARQHLADLSADLVAVRRHAAPLLWLCPYLGWLPVHGADVAAVPALLDLGDHLTAAGLLALDGLAPVVESSGANDGSAVDRLSGALDGLATAQPQLAAASAQLAQAEAVWADLTTMPLSASLAEPLGRAGDYLPALRSAVQLSTLAPTLLGAGGARTYLILAQNEDELRPTGGFISAAGLVTFEGGRITRLEFQDSYAVDDLSRPYPDPPVPLRRTMLADLWLFRDINWSADFPTAARAAADAYAYGRGVAVDGVVALDQQAVQILLEGLGPVTIEATGETVTADNVIQAIRTHWAPAPGQGLTGEWWQQRKSFLGDLAAAVRRRLESDAGALDLPALARAAHRALAGKHLLVHAWQPEVADALRRAGWNGAIGPAGGDYLLVVDANVGFNKASARVTRQIDYRVALDDTGAADVWLAVEYRHAGTAGVERCVPEVRYDETYDRMMERCLWNYVRVYVPDDAVLDAGPERVVPGEAMLSGVATSGALDIEPGEGGTVSYGTQFVLKPGETTALTYGYHRPAGATRSADRPDLWRYDLVLQTQAGTDRTTVHMQLTLPMGAVLVSGYPVPDHANGPDVGYRLNLDEDRRLSVTYRLPGGW